MADIERINSSEREIPHASAVGWERGRKRKTNTVAYNGGRDNNPNVKIEYVDIAKAYRYRLYPDSKRQRELDGQIELARLLYNKLLGKAKDEYKRTKNLGIKPSTFNRFLREAKAENKEFSGLYSQVQREAYFRLIKAYQNFFRRVKEKRVGKKVKAGFPRFRARGRYASITYPQFGFRVDRERKDVHMLRVSKIGGMRIELHRPIEGDIKTLTIKKEAGEYYAIFSAIDRVLDTPRVMDTYPVGIDMGLETFATLSDGRKIKKPDFARTAERRIAKWQRVVARRQKGSKRRDKARLKLEREWQAVNNQTKDFVFKAVGDLIGSGYTSFAVEGLHIQNMLQNHRLARSIQNASWSRFISTLSCKAEEAGMTMTVVDARNTSQECSKCGKLNSLSLSDRTFSCACGYVADRDVNAAINILNRATAGQAGSHARGDLASTHSVRDGRAGSLKREHTQQEVSMMSNAGEARGL